MSDAKSNTTENALLLMIFNSSNIANLCSANGRTQLFFSLHTSSPGEAGDQTTNECAYTSYARVGVDRSGSGFTVTNNSVSPAAAVTFPAATGGTETATHFGVGTDSAGAGVLLYYGAISPNVSISSGVTPRLTTSTAITES